MRRRIAAAAVAGLLTACSGPIGPPSTSPSPSVDPATPSATPSDTPASTPSPEPSPSPEPGAMPSSYAPDDEPGEVPPEALVPVGATVTGRWFAFTDDGVRIAIAWTEPAVGVDRVPAGLAVWRHVDTSPHWRPSFVRRRRGRAGVTAVDASIADVTGDRSDDLLVFEGTGGSGACGTWFAVELLEPRSIYRKELCDGRVEPAPPARPGLVLTELVFQPGDAHCCPSAILRTTLEWTGSRWRVRDRRESAT